MMQNGYNYCFQSVSAFSSNSDFWGLGQNSLPETQAQSQSALFEKLYQFFLNLHRMEFYSAGLWLSLFCATSYGIGITSICANQNHSSSTILYAMQSVNTYCMSIFQQQKFQSKSYIIKNFSSPKTCLHMSRPRILRQPFTSVHGMTLSDHVIFSYIYSRSLYRQYLSRPFWQVESLKKLMMNCCF